MATMQTQEKTVSTGTLWFGVGASACAWCGLGMGDVLLTWRACLHAPPGGPSAEPGTLVICFALTLVLLGVAIVAGTMSYRNWKTLSGTNALLQAEGRERKEFMALAGLFVSFTLGFGIFWLGLPLFLIRTCIRAR